MGVFSGKKKNEEQDADDGHVQTTAVTFHRPASEKMAEDNNDISGAGNDSYSYV